MKQKKSKRSTVKKPRPIKWPTFSKKTFPKLWDSLSVNQRQHSIVGNSFLSFKTWAQLNKVERAKIFDQIKQREEQQFIMREIAKFIRELEKIGAKALKREAKERW